MAMSLLRSNPKQPQSIRTNSMLPNQIRAKNKTTWANDAKKTNKDLILNQKEIETITELTNDIIGYPNDSIVASNSTSKDLIESEVPNQGLTSEFEFLNKVSQHKHDAEQSTVTSLLEKAKMTKAQWQEIKQHACDLVTNIRKDNSSKKGIDLDALMAEYDLSNNEGIALMCLAEALLRIPDDYTADKLIKDKICGADWAKHLDTSESIFVNAATWSLVLTGKVLPYGETDDPHKRAWSNFVNRSSETVVRTAIRTAMQMFGSKFVMEENIPAALKRAKENESKGFRYSYDMLGEAATNAADAETYYQSYLSATHSIGKAYKDKDLEESAGISIKLSALHPRYELQQYKRVMKEMLPKVLELARQAKHYDMNLTIDAEEADRLELSLMILNELAHHDDLKGWDGLGLAVQAYHKRAPHILQHLIDLAKDSNRRFMIRLVKGAYWDSEIKHAQELGLAGYPVYTRKAHTDISYMACTKILLEHPEAFYAQFATHNALSLATVLVLAGDRKDYEFQCLYGMGDILYKDVVEQGKPCRIYAPVGSYKHLLAYLVRRLLENGANSSFVNQIVNADISLDDLTTDPIAVAKHHDCQQHSKIPNPRNIYGDRANATGIDLSNPQVLGTLLDELNIFSQEQSHAMSIPSKPARPESHRLSSTNPANHNEVIGHLYHSTHDDATAAIGVAAAAFPSWEATPPIERAQKLDRMADLLEENMVRLMALVVKESGKSVGNSVGEVREAIDFCRYYANQVREDFVHPKILPGPTGEVNKLHLRGRGVFVCISPWNFPLAIFLGEVTAALAAGNTVVAKPAEQTSLIAAAAVELLYQAGIPRNVVQFVPGSGASVGETLTSDPRIAGVIFTGSTKTAKAIQNVQANKKGAITKLIAETGGQNAMIVDSSALPEQVVTDVINSAFDSAGQRCSALRVLYLQEEIADEVIDMLTGAMDELKVGDPMAIDTDVGPVIDQNAKDMLTKHIDKLTKADKLLHQVKLNNLPEAGTFVPPTLFELESMDDLQAEVFGPVLHIIRFKAKELDHVIDEINGTGYGLTFGIHSRIQETIDYVTQRIRAGNLYVNRNTVGAIVGVQPFGGEGLSGSGPKAGGPFYLHSLATERVISVDTTASGGNASLMTLE